VLGCQDDANFKIRSQIYEIDKFVKYW